MDAARSRARVRAPDLRGRGWLNTGGRALTLVEPGLGWRCACSQSGALAVAAGLWVV